MYNDEIRPELHRRWDTLRSALAEQGGDALLVTTNANLFYVSSRVFSGMAYLTPQSDPLFFVRRPTGLSGEEVIYIRKPEEMAERLAERGLPLPETLFLESDSVSYNEYLRYTKILRPAKVENGTRLLRSARSIKSPYEIAKLKEFGTAACRTIPADSLALPPRNDGHRTLRRHRIPEPEARIAAAFSAFSDRAWKFS